MKAPGAAKAVVIAMMALIIAGIWYFLGAGQQSPAVPEPITVGGPLMEQSVFLYVAQEQGYFTKNGLNVTIRDDYPNGVVPVGDLIEGDLDLALSAEYPVVSRAFNYENIRIVASVDKYQNEKIIGLKSHGIRNVSDLRGKKIGVPRQTICEFFLGRFLELHGLGFPDVELVDVPANRSVEAISNGSVDAIVYYQPYVYAIESRLQDDGIVWEVQSNRNMYCLITARNEWITSHPETLTRFLKALDEAEAYSISHPAETREIVGVRMNVSDEYLDIVWPYHQFSLSLDQSLLIAMNDEGRWAINNNLTDETVLPDYSTFIYPDSLRKIRPGSVNIG